jgi:hypothetical protein
MFLIIFSHKIAPSCIWSQIRQCNINIAKGFRSISPEWSISPRSRLRCTERRWERPARPRSQLQSFRRSWVRGPVLTLPLGANFDPQWQSCPPGVKFVP